MIDEKLLLEILKEDYLTSDDYQNDIFLVEDVEIVIDEILNEKYKNKEVCYNCLHKEKCKYKNKCKIKGFKKNYFQSNFKKGDLNQ